MFQNEENFEEVEPIDLKNLEHADLTEAEAAIFAVLRGLLQYPSPVQARGALLADTINFFCNARDQQVYAVGETLFDIWSIVMDLARNIPPDHAWQRSLVEALKVLRRVDSTVGQVSKGAKWEDLPNFSLAVRDQWDDPTGTLEDLDEPGKKDLELAKWCNLNSFLIRIALEEPGNVGDDMECRLWVASEWLLQCSDLLYNDMISGRQLDADEIRSLEPGSLIEGVPALSIERWKHWKARATAFAWDQADHELSEGLKTKLVETVAHMSIVDT